MSNIVRVLTNIDKSGGETNQEARKAIKFSNLIENKMA
jgi:hypothetical protein